MKVYSTQTIAKACRLYQQGVHVRKILRQVSMKGYGAVYFHCDPARRKKMNERNVEWRKRNPEAWHAIVRKAVKKYNQKKKKQI